MFRQNLLAGILMGLALIPVVIPVPARGHVHRGVFTNVGIAIGAGVAIDQHETALAPAPAIGIVGVVVMLRRTAINAHITRAADGQHISRQIITPRTEATVFKIEILAGAKVFAGISDDRAVLKRNVFATHKIHIGPFDLHP